MLPKSKDKKEDEEKEDAADGGGGDDGMDEGELNSELAMQEYERKRKHLRAEAEREKRRKDTRSKASSVYFTIIRPLALSISEECFKSICLFNAS